MPPIPWLPAIARAFLPRRWFACLIGLTLSEVIVWASLAVLLPDSDVSLTAFIERRGELVQEVGEQLDLSARWSVLVGGFVLVSLLAGVWSTVGGFIARDELLWRLSGPVTQPRPTPLGFVVRQAARLWALVPMIGIFLGLLFLACLTAAGILLVPGGSLLVALFLPLLWLVVLLQAAVLLGASSFVLQPACLAAEGSDAFDAWSRGYSYFYMRPVMFLLLQIIVAAIATAPLYALSQLLEGTDGIEPVPRLVAYFLLGGLSLSLFWSMQAVVYLVLRWQIDATAPDEIHVETAAELPLAVTPPAAPAGPPPTPTPGGLVMAGNGLLAAAMIAASWLLMGRMLTWLVGERAAWLRWELLPPAWPEVAGIDRVASWGAGFWLVVGLTLALLVPLRRALRRSQGG
jgi:hypothetical protein